MRRFDDARYYLTTDPELELLGSRFALAKQHSRGVGPRYFKVGKRILYLGRDLNAYLDASAIEPTGGPVARTDTEAMRRKERLDPNSR